ncbi:tRNA (adenosine(37)-N6)-threonylcarbamoyltransferase complex transferase subunit TsaD [Eubacteriales bacterium OttesenSCG-928-N14]|nr:tRNA (adenosine(37)-N6)-threonylcarbamoyltransferase complex transferase subunit TsaD [Eubacteriales bacterium OttesenSCG-928-N14]
MRYLEAIQPKLSRLADGNAAILAIESSCDETAAAVVTMDMQVLSSVIASQVDTHAIYGGVVPEIASRMHMEALPHVVSQALEQAGMGFDDIAAVAGTYGPGLVGALLTGLCYAKGIAYAKSLPFVGVNHMVGHIFANHISHPDLQPPYLCLLVSGGHTHLVLVEENMRLTVLGKSQDDAVGEAFDKVARILGLPYPGGPNLERLAAAGNAAAFSFTLPKLQNQMDFSFSGLKTAVVNLAHTMEQKGQPLPRADIAASFQAHAVEFLLYSTQAALEYTGATQLAICGGVSANGYLRAAAAQRCEQENIRLFLPDSLLTTDNAAMIGAAGAYQLKHGQLSGMEINAYPSLNIV